MADEKNRAENRSNSSRRGKSGSEKNSSSQSGRPGSQSNEGRDEGRDERPRPSESPGQRPE